jgi:ribose 5-phosphate isomerase B
MAGEHLGRFPGTQGLASLPDATYRTERESYNGGDTVHRVAVGADHGGLAHKKTLVEYLEQRGYTVTDVGTYTEEKVDYPDYAVRVAEAVRTGDCDRGIMIDAAGIGSSMVCNKVPGIRAALCYSRETIMNSRQHNNANVLTLGARFHDHAEMCELVALWLETKFEGGRHWPRINKMMATERGRYRE